MTDPVLAMIEHELGKLQTLHVFKMSGIVEPPSDRFEADKNRKLRRYNHTLKSILKGYKWLMNEYTGKQRRREIQKWATVLYKDGRRKVLSYRGTVQDIAEGRAYMDASNAIIAAFKQL